MKKKIVMLAMAITIEIFFISISYTEDKGVKEFLLNEEWKTSSIEQRRGIVKRVHPKLSVDEDALGRSESYTEYLYWLNRNEDERERKRSLKEAPERAKAQKRKEAEQKRIREEAIKAQPFNIQKLINEKEIGIGMTKEQVVLSWGKPKDIHRHVGRWGVHEQWVYSDNVFLYFENDILTSWQD
jgi:hypothetical protein